MLEKLGFQHPGNAPRSCIGSHHNSQRAIPPSLMRSHSVTFGLQHDLVRHTVTTVLSRFRDHIGLYLAPPPADGEGRPAGAVKYACFRKAGYCRHHIRPITIGTEGDQVSSETPRAFHATANSVSHYDPSSQNWQPDRGESQ